MSARRRVPWVRRRSAAFAHPYTPYPDRATGLLEPAPRNLTRFIAIEIHLRRSRPDDPCPETPPSFSTDGYLAENLVIAGCVTTCNTSRNTRGRRRPVVSPSRCSRSRHLLHLVGLVQSRGAITAIFRPPRNSQKPRKHWINFKRFNDRFYIFWPAQRSNKKVIL